MYIYFELAFYVLIVVDVSNLDAKLDDYFILSFIITTQCEEVNLDANLGGYFELPL